MKRQSHRGFIFLFGWRVIGTRDSAAPVVAPCPNCKQRAARLEGRLRRTWFTLFFVPIFPIESAAKGQRITLCRECRAMFDMPIEQFARKSGAMSGASFADTIVVYNQLREHPEDGKMMLKLLQMYDELQELGEAEAAARHFPQALAADPACGKLLAAMKRAMTP